MGWQVVCCGSSVHGGDQTKKLTDFPQRLDFFSRRQNNENNPHPDDESPCEFCLAFLLSSKEKNVCKIVRFSIIRFLQIFIF